MKDKLPITAFTLPELEAQMEIVSESKYRAQQVMDWLYKKTVLSFEEMTNLSLETRQKFSEHFSITSSNVKKVFTSQDGTRKILVELSDPPDQEVIRAGKACVECVLMSETDEPERLGESSGTIRHTLCISTQVGCPVKCRFCASGAKGLIRSLKAGEIVDEVLLAELLLKPEGLRVNNIVVMGMGEPFMNYDNLIKALTIITATWGFGIGKNKITVSTVGLPDKIAQFAKEKVATNLAISLHSSKDEIRRQIIPLANIVSVKELVEAARRYNQETGKDITFEYLMIEGLNTDEASARDLASLILNTGGKINLIAYNEVPGLPYRAPSLETILRFQNILRQVGLIAMLRKSKGSDISAACGQLAFGM